MSHRNVRREFASLMGLERLESRVLLSAAATDPRLATAQFIAQPALESSAGTGSSQSPSATVMASDPIVNLTAMDAFVTEGDSFDELTNPEWGQPVNVAVVYQISNLPADASYRIEFTLNGETNSFSNVTYGAGVAGTFWVTYRMSGYFVGLGTNNISATVDADNTVVESNETENSFSTTFQGNNSGGLASYSIPQLSTDPGAAQTLYLDFDGNFESQWETYSNITTPAFTVDSDVATLNPYEAELIQKIWERVAEDFAPFNINVTTIDPGNFSNGVSLRAAIGGYDTDWYGSSAGGVGIIDGFTNSGSNTVFVFSAGYRYNPDGIGGTISHEAGHGFGLSHQSQYGPSGNLIAEYNPGTAESAPIMGGGNSGRDIWWYGPTPVSSSTFQDDMAVLAKSQNLFGYRNDDVGDTLATAKPLVIAAGATSAAGIITKTTDIDVYSFSTSGGAVSFQVKGAENGANLLALVELRDSTNNLITSATTGYDTAAVLNSTLPAGSYQLVIKSTGGYGSVGRYSISGTVPQSTNHAPTGLALSKTGVSENQPIGTVVGTFSATDPDPGSTLTYTLATGTGSTDNGSFTIDGKQLKTNAVFDFEGKTSYSIRVRVTDNTGLTLIKVFTININNQNEAPTAISISRSYVGENQPVNSYVGTLGATDPDAGSTFTYTLAAGAGSTDNGSFKIVGNELLTNAVFDYATKSSYSIRVRVTDNSGLTFIRVFTISITAANRPPIALFLTSTSIEENKAAGTTVGTFSASDPDPGSTFTYTLAAGTGSTDNGSFTIVGNQLKTNSVFDSETKNIYSIRVRVTDNGGLTFIKVFTIYVTDVNEAPTGLALSSTSVNENQPVGTVVGTLSVTDPDNGGFYYYTFATGTGSTDNASFTISGGQVKTNAVFDYETKNTYSIRVRVTDNGGLTFVKIFTIKVLNLPE